MRLKHDMEAFQKEMLPSMPKEALAAMMAATETLVSSGIGECAKKVGDIAPLFTLDNTAGTAVSMHDLLQQGSVILNFYRGAWCPYCNLELKAWAKCMPQLKKRGASLVSITPNLREKSAALLTDNPFDFDILCDLNNQVANAYGLVFELAKELRPIYQNFGINLQEYDGNARYELPIPATYVVGRNGIISSAFVNADYTQRIVPCH